MVDQPRATRGSDVAARAQRLQVAAANAGYEAVVLSRVGTVAWLTAGADFSLATSNSSACASVAVTADALHVFAYTMDVERLMSGPHGEALVMHPLTWQSEAPLASAMKYAHNLAKAVCDDIADIPGFLLKEMWRLDELDLARVAYLGQLVGDLVHEVAMTIRPGDTGRSIAGRLARQVYERGLALHELMVGVDGQLLTERHPAPGDQGLERVALVHPTVGRWGLHAMTSRVISCRKAPSIVRAAMDSASRVEARTVMAALPGTTYGEVLAVTRDAWNDEGRPDEWLMHFQGGRTGYLINEPMHATSPGSRLSTSSVHNWFITCAGAKKEEMWLTERDGIARCVTLGDWPRTRPIAGGPRVAEILAL